MDEDTYFLREGWFLHNFGDAGTCDEDPPLERIMFDDYRARIFHAMLDGEDWPLASIEQLVAVILEQQEAGDNEMTYFPMKRAIEHIFIAGLIAMTEDNTDKRVERAISAIELWKALRNARKMKRKLPRWRAKFYPVLVRGKLSIFNEIEEHICEICNHKQWTSDRAIKEAFIYGLRRMRKNLDKKWKRHRARDLTWIYGLIDPRDHQVYYIGQSIHPVVRWQQHLIKSKGSPSKNAWLKELANKGMAPDIRILAETTPLYAHKVEQEWIEQGKELGWPLTNGIPGRRPNS